MMETVGAAELVVSSRGLREGAALLQVSDDLPPPRTVRTGSLRTLASRFSTWDAPSGERRASIASRLALELDPQARPEVLEMLDHAATILDIGRAIDYYDRFEHAAMLVGEAGGGRVVDDQRADRTPFVVEPAGQHRLELVAMRAAPVGARREAKRDLAPRPRLPFEQRLGPGPVPVAARVPLGIVSEEQRGRDERHEAIDLLVNQRHRIENGKARTERLRDLVQRLLFAVRAGDVLERPFVLRRRRGPGGSAGCRGRCRCWPLAA